MESITIKDDFIKLGQALKLAGLAGSGVDAKFMIEDGIVSVNGEVEFRRGRKVRPGDVIELEGHQVKVNHIWLLNLWNYWIFAIMRENVLNLIKIPMYYMVIMHREKQMFWKRFTFVPLPDLIAEAKINKWFALKCRKLIYGWIFWKMRFITKLIFI